MLEAHVDEGMEAALKRVISASARPRTARPARGEDADATQPLMTVDSLNSTLDRPHREVGDLPPFMRALVSELIGTAILIGIGCTCLMGNAATPFAATLLPAFVFPVTLFVLILTIGPISGCHLNPYLTFALVLAGECTIVRGAAYAVVQVIGSILGATFVRLAADPPPGASHQAICVGLAPHVGPFQGILVEFAITAILVLAVTLMYVWQPRIVHTASSLEGPLTVMFVVMANIMCAAQLTGGAMNYARVIGPAIVMGGSCWDHHFVYPLGGFAGAAAGMVLGGALSPLAQRHPIKLM